MKRALTNQGPLALVVVMGRLFAHHPETRSTQGFFPFRQPKKMDHQFEPPATMARG